jgi:glutamate-5-semialdehyde dehydrogenase
MTDTSVSEYMATLGQAARRAAVLLAKAPTKAKNAALVAIAARMRAYLGKGTQ